VSKHQPWTILAFAFALTVSASLLAFPFWANSPSRKNPNDPRAQSYIQPTPTQSNTPTCTLSRFAGLGNRSYSTVAGNAHATSFAGIRKMGVYNNELYFTSSVSMSNCAVWKIDVNDNLTLVAGKGSSGPVGVTRLAATLPYLIDVAASATEVFFATTQKVYKIDSSGMISIWAGGGTDQTSENTTATNAICYINDIDVYNGELYISENGGASSAWSLRIRKIGIDGKINTIAGGVYSGGLASSGDGGLAISAIFAPEAMIIVGSNIYLSDYSASAIRKVDLNTGIITRHSSTQGSAHLICSDGGEIYAKNTNTSSNVWISRSPNNTYALVRSGDIDGYYDNMSAIGWLRLQSISGIAYFKGKLLFAVDTDYCMILQVNCPY
jgi:hypothetical protein